MVEIAQNLGLIGVARRPAPLLLEGFIKRVGVRHALDVAAAPGIAIPVPRATNAWCAVNEVGVQATLSQAAQEIEATKARTDD